MQPRRLLALAILALAYTNFCHAEIAGLARVIDGDTIVVNEVRLRLWGIDAPETDQTCTRAKVTWECGTGATAALRAMIADKPVVCDELGKDRWQRPIVKCRVGSIDLNDYMVRTGWALAFRRYSKDYVPVEDEARAKRVGMWQGDFVPPWDWRAGVREPTTVTAAPVPDPKPEQPGQSDTTSCADYEGRGFFWRIMRKIKC